MPDQKKAPERPRVALVFGDAGCTGHLRDAVSSHVDIVYETSAADFDVSRVAGAQATAALVNLDDCTSLDNVETRLQEAGITVVFNDPEISSKLEGWAQARWLRHLLAKLSGSSDFDPPRPAEGRTVAVPAEAVLAVETPLEENAVIGSDEAVRVLEKPLSPDEIESMTANFAAIQTASTPVMDLDAVSLGLAIDRTGASAAGTPPVVVPPVAMDHHVSMPDAHASDPDTTALDVDTEALSAMIDARLAATEGVPAAEPSEVWREVDGRDVSTEPVPSEPRPMESAPAGMVHSASSDDADVLQALPSLDEWQLVDPEAPVAQVSSPRHDEHALPAFSIDFSGLELVPVETAEPIASNPAPLERWMHDVEGDKDKAAAQAQSSAQSGGGRA